MPPLAPSYTTAYVQLHHIFLLTVQPNNCGKESVGNTVRENSTGSIFSPIQMYQLPSVMACWQYNFVPQNLPVLNRM